MGTISSDIGNKIGSNIDEVRIDGCLEKFQSDLEKINALGIKAVELPAHGLDVIFNGKLNFRRQLEIINILNNFKFAYSIHSPNPLDLMDQQDPDLHVDIFLATLEFARQINAKTVVYHAGRFFPEEKFNVFPSRDISQKEKKSMLQQEAMLLQSISKQYNDVNIAIENARPYLSQSPYTYGESIDKLKQQIIRINRDNVKINLDFGHIHMTSTYYGDDLLEAVKPIKDLIIHTHIHDNFGNCVFHWEKQQTHQLPFGKGDSHMPVGWGDTPIKEILEILLPQYKGLLIIELKSRYFNYIKESKLNLKELINTV